MKKPRVTRGDKAYKDLSFLNSPDARSLRILSEFLQPLAKFRREGIRDTIVFFGSARVCSRKDSLAAVREAERKVQRRSTPSARAALDSAHRALGMSKYYEDAVSLSKMLTEWSRNLAKPNRFVMCSGGGPGIMEAANRGALLAKGKSVGLNISLPFEQLPNQFISPELNFEFHYFFMRKFWFVYLAKAFVMFPGGFGTFDELMEVLTLLQTSKVKKPVVVVLYGKEYWDHVIRFDEMVRRGLIDSEDLKLFSYADTPEEAFRTVTGALRKLYPEESRLLGGRRN